MSDPTSTPSSPPAPRVRVRPGQTKDSLNVVDVPLELCRPDPNQPRQAFDEASLAELAASIERHGLLQPVTVRRDPRKKGAYVIVAGERRYRAFEKLGKESIPAIVTAGNPDELSLIENLQREDLSPIEEAEALQRLQKKYGYTQKEIGEAIGKAKSTVSHLLKLNTLPRQIKQEVATSHPVGRSLLIEISKLDSKQEQLAFWAAAKQGGMTVKRARAKKRGETPASPRPPVPPTGVLEKGEAFLSSFERLTKDDAPIDKEGYDRLLELFERFVALLDREAERQQEA